MTFCVLQTEARSLNLTNNMSFSEVELIAAAESSAQRYTIKIIA